jgi:S1-C subfamily serine protease
MKRAAFGFLGILFCLGAVGTAKGNDSPEHIFKRHKNAIVRIYVNGTFRVCGFIVSQDGLVVTAKHVVADAEFPSNIKAAGVEVQQRKGKKPYELYPAMVVDSSAITDTALLRTIAIGLSPVPLAKVPVSRVGVQGTMVSVPPNSDSASMASGLITDAKSVSQNRLNARVLVAQIAAGAECSGAPLFDDRGRVIGMVDELAGTSADSNAQGSAVDILYAEQMIEKEVASQISRIPPEGPAPIDDGFSRMDTGEAGVPSPGAPH